MSQVDTNLKLVRTKLALAEKYDNLARIAGSQAKRTKFHHSATKYRRQAARLSQRTQEPG